MDILLAETMQIAIAVPGIGSWFSIENEFEMFAFTSECDMMCISYDSTDRYGEIFVRSLNWSH